MNVGSQDGGCATLVRHILQSAVISSFFFCLGILIGVTLAQC